MFSDRELHHAYRYCVALTGDRDQAYDLLQSGMVKWLERKRAEVDNPAGYLRRILRNCFLDSYREKQAVLELGIEEVGGDVIAYDGRDLETMTLQADLTQAIMAALAPMDRELLFLWAVEGFTVQEISDLVNRPRGTLLSRLHRLRKKIQAEFPRLQKEVYP